MTPSCFSPVRVLTNVMSVGHVTSHTRGGEGKFCVSEKNGYEKLF